MFDRLFEIFNNISPEPIKETTYRGPIEAPSIASEETPNDSTLIGYDYLMKEEEEPVKPRRFARLSEFLRGRYK